MICGNVKYQRFILANSESQYTQTSCVQSFALKGFTFIHPQHENKSTYQVMARIACLTQSLDEAIRFPAVWYNANCLGKHTQRLPSFVFFFWANFLTTCWPGVAGSCHGRSRQVCPVIRCTWRSLAAGGRAQCTAASWRWAAARCSTPDCSAAGTGTEPESRPPSMYMSQVRSYSCCPRVQPLFFSLALVEKAHTPSPPHAYCLYPQVKQDVVGAKYRPMPESQ